jgi:polyisoprenoid-binding protein YceI
MLAQCARCASVSAAAATALALLLLAVLGRSNARAEHFAFDRQRTEVHFVYTMLFVARRGRFTEVSGALDYDDAKPEASRVAATIATNSLSTGAPIIDNELKGASFFNVKAAPAIDFKSRKVQPQGKGAAEVAGDITINGITRPATLKITVQPYTDPKLKNEAGARIFRATTRILRSAFKMSGWSFAVADEVDIEIAAVLRPGK